MITRRSFLGAMLAAAAAPAFVRYEWLMRPRALTGFALTSDGLGPLLYVALYTSGTNELPQEASYAEYARQTIRRSPSNGVLIADGRAILPAIDFPQCAGGTETIRSGAILDQFGHTIYDFSLGPDPIRVSAGITPRILGITLDG